MGLSNETAPNTAVIDAYRASIDERHARNLASRLIRYEHNPDPREAPDPSKGIRIRRPILAFRSGDVNVSEECKAQSLATATLGQGEEWLASWQNPRLG
jgi:hypothetical protein